MGSIPIPIPCTAKSYTPLSQLSLLMFIEAVFKPPLVGIKLAVKLADPPAVILSGRLIPPIVNEEASLPLSVILFTSRLTKAVF